MKPLTQHPAGARRQASRHLIVLYDAECGFCAATTRWLRRRDRDARLTFLPLQAARQAERARVREVALTHDLPAALHVIDERTGRVEASGAAMLAVLGVLPRWWIAARLVSVGPARRLTELGYRLGAGHRDRVGRLLGVGGASCRVAHGADSIG
ncbi:MAG: DCC1-like thiol-disulfide oxidoreductase family protein [Candidatus Limnocylindrales bacterium]